jgi:type I restriction enzyme, S subunit
MVANVRWPTKRLAELAEFRNGVNYNKGSFGEGVKVVGVSDFQDYTKPRYAELEQINPEGIVTERNILRDGDIVFVRSNGNRELIGRSLFIEQPPEEVTHSAFTIRLRFTSREVHPKFYAYCFRTPLIRQGLTAQGGGTNINNLNQDILNSLEVPFPPLPVQRRIAGILSAYDELMENSQRRIRILETMARALYREWFVYFRFPGHEKVPRVASPLGNIPQGWEVKTVANSFEISGGGTPSRKESEYWDGGIIQWFSPSDLTGAGTMFMDDSSDHITELGLAKSSARLFPARSVMLTSRATIGAIAINAHEACTNQGFITCLPNERVPLYFLYHWLRENVPTFQRMASGATFKEISRGVFKTIEFLQPPAKLVRRFEDAAAPMAEQALTFQRQIQNLRRTRDLLLPRLLSGQVELETEEAVA